MFKYWLSCKISKLNLHGVRIEVLMTRLQLISLFQSINQLKIDFEGKINNFVYSTEFTCLNSIKYLKGQCSFVRSNYLIARDL